MKAFFDIVRAKFGPAGQQTQIRVQAGGLRVVVARADVDVAAEPGALAPHD